MKMNGTTHGGDDRMTQVADALVGDVGLLAAVAWRRAGAVEQLEVARIAPVLADRLGLLHDLAVAAGHDLDTLVVSASSG